MKAYKIFNNDWTCNGLQYEVGKTYEMGGETSICSSGFHGCLELADCAKYYELVQWNKIAEVEITRGIKKAQNDSKICGNKIKIVREISFMDGVRLVGTRLSKSKGVTGSNGVSWSDGVTRSEGVAWSNGVSWSEGVAWSKGVTGSKGVAWSDGVARSEGVAWSNGVASSDGVARSEGVAWSDGVTGSQGVAGSNGVEGSNGVASSDGVEGSQGVAGSDGVARSQGVARSFGVKASAGISENIFCSGQKSIPRLFNKRVSKERFDLVMKEMKKKLDWWIPTFNNLKSLYLKNGSDWASTPIPKAQVIQLKEAWADFPKEAEDYLRSLPEFNEAVFNDVTGRSEEK